jgi:hypothetical protein
MTIQACLGGQPGEPSGPAFHGEPGPGRGEGVYREYGRRRPPTVSGGKRPAEFSPVYLDDTYLKLPGVGARGESGPALFLQPRGWRGADIDVGSRMTSELP